MMYTDPPLTLFPRNFLIQTQHNIYSPVNILGSFSGGVPSSLVLSSVLLNTGASYALSRIKFVNFIILLFSKNIFRLAPEQNGGRRHIRYVLPVREVVGSLVVRPQKV